MKEKRKWFEINKDLWTIISQHCWIVDGSIFYSPWMNGGQKRMIEKERNSRNKKKKKMLSLNNFVCGLAYSMVFFFWKFEEMKKERDRVKEKKHKCIIAWLYLFHLKWWNCWAWFSQQCRAINSFIYLYFFLFFH